MLCVCVVGHSLVQSAIPLNVPSVQLDIIRHPGAAINSLTDKLTDMNFWSRHYDGIILCIGGNDLSRLSVDEVFSRLCDLARRLRTQTTFLTVCTIEYRMYPYYNRFRVIKRRIDTKKSQSTVKLSASREVLTVKL